MKGNYLKGVSIDTGIVTNICEFGTKMGSFLYKSY